MILSAHKMCEFDLVDDATSHFFGMWKPVLPSMSVACVFAASALLLVLALSSRSVVSDLDAKHFDLSPLGSSSMGFCARALVPSASGFGHGAVIECIRRVSCFLFA